MSQSNLRNTLFLLLGLCSVAFADKEDDFRVATTTTGCDSIPYSDLRSNCRSQQSDVHPWCDGPRGPVSCRGESASLTPALKRALASAEDELRKLEEKHRESKDKHSRATDDADKAKWKTEFEANEKEIDAAKKKLEQAKRAVIVRKDHVEKTIHTLGKCIDYRRAVMNVYAYAADKTRGESDENIKPLAQTLRDMWAAEISGHEEQIGGRSNAVEFCKSEMP